MLGSFLALLLLLSAFLICLPVYLLPDAIQHRLLRLLSLGCLLLGVPDEDIIEALCLGALQDLVGFLDENELLTLLPLLLELEEGRAPHVWVEPEGELPELLLNLLRACLPTKSQQFVVVSPFECLSRVEMLMPIVIIARAIMTLVATTLVVIVVGTETSTAGFEETP